MKYDRFLVSHWGTEERVRGAPRNFLYCLWYAVWFPYTKAASQYQGVRIRRHIKVEDW